MTRNQSIHATCVAWNGQAILIVGASGTGKSALGLTLIGMNCQLVADDRVALSVQDDSLWAHAPQTIFGLIEARGIGVLKCAAIETAQVQLVVDLDHTEKDRLPDRRYVTILGREMPLTHKVEGPHFASAILQILKAGWSNR